MNGSQGTRGPDIPPVTVLSGTVAEIRYRSLQSNLRGRGQVAERVGLEQTFGRTFSLSLTGEGAPDSPSPSDQERQLGPPVLRPYSEQDAALADGWRSFLGAYKWDYFLTVSFREPQGPGKAVSILTALSKTLASKYAPRYTFLVSEPHRTGLLHLHGLMMLRIEHEEFIRRSKARKVWGTLYQRYGVSRVDTLQSVGGVSGYVTKYMTKGVQEWTLTTPP